MVALVLVRQQENPPALPGGFLFVERDFFMTVTMVALLVVIMLALGAAVHDWRGLRIPNWISLAIVALFACVAVLAPASVSPLWPHLAAGAGMLLVTFAMFARGLFGGGDAKLASALALWLGLKGLVPFMMFTGLAGGVLAVAALYIKAKKPFVNVKPESWVAQVQGGRNSLPYGIAIALGMAAAVFHTPPYADNLHELINLIH